MDDIYEKKICKGMCLQADSLGLCMGICGTDNAYAQQAYDKFKERANSQGKPWTPIIHFEKGGPALQNDIPVRRIVSERISR